MKILITSDWYQPVINGVVTSVVNLSDSLRAMGHEVRILTLSGSHRSYRKGNVSYIGSVSVGMIYPNARLRTARGEALLRELIQWKPDIIHSQCEFSTFSFAKRISRACRCPLVHTYHTVYEDFTHYFSPNVRFGRFLAARFSRYILAQTDAVIVPTDKIRKMLRGYGVDRPLFTVPTGLKLHAFFTQISPEERSALRVSLGLCEDDLVFLYIGRLAKEKNVSELMEFLRSAPENARLLLVGDGPYRSELEAEAVSLGMKERIVFAGMVPPSKIAAYYQCGDIFVSASQSETQGLTYIEAMASGLPLLCRKDDCLDHVIEPGVTGFAYTSADEFSAAVQTLSDAALRTQFGIDARRLAQERFSAEGFAAAALRVYQACLSGTAGKDAA